MNAEKARQDALWAIETVNSGREAHSDAYWVGYLMSVLERIAEHLGEES